MRATERMSHLLLEIYHRLASVRLAQDHRFDLLLTQEQLSDVLGLSAVHINRTLQTLRREGLIECHGAHVRLLRPDDLAQAAHFALPDAFCRSG
jgi:DNA-binding transcriptional regulator LsrR (DeoR family)